MPVCNDTQLFRFVEIRIKKKIPGLGIIKIIILIISGQCLFESISSQKNINFKKNKNYQVKKDKLKPSKEDKLK